jgi:hypothetical protein
VAVGLSWVAVPASWTDAELGELIEEILVDAYGESEQLSSFDCAFSELDWPVAARTLGTAVTMTGVWFSGDERNGLEADLLVDGRSHRVRLLDVEITDEAHEAARVLAAFRWWWVPNE